MKESRLDSFLMERKKLRKQNNLDFQNWRKIYSPPLKI